MTGGVGYDLAVIGSGGGAFAAAIAARRKGRSVVMIERATTGGTCVNVGCVPSKALLAAAAAHHVAGAQAFPGIGTDAGPVDMAALIAGKDGLVEGLRAEKYVDLAADYGWEIVTGQASFVEGPALKVDHLPDGDTMRIEARHYLIATGSAPWVPAVDGLAESGFLTSTTAMELQRVPASLLVLGGGYVGLEQAQLFARLGAKVTVLVRGERLARAEEPQVSEVIAGVFADEGITVVTGARLQHVCREAGGQVRATAVVDGAQRDFHGEHVLVAMGRRPVTDGLNLEPVGVKVGDRGQVVVDKYLRTNNTRIWAAGDVTGYPQFVYVAAAHGALVADNALDGAGRTLDYTHLPRVTFTTPAIASVGLTDSQAIEAGFSCECRVLPLQYVPRALVNRDTRGLVKIVAERGSGRVLGVHMIADGAADAIQAAVYAVQTGMTTAQMAQTWAPYLTMAEALKLAAQTFTTDVTKLSCCA
ncbi:Mercuric reductase [Mycobacterium marinum]|uniref:mercury(II) reductase n=1 Tax=Mycobacterium marinum TaxID=1781 RepID=UPI000E3C4CFB|nr:mercury(II) reductase [Mycobacterium marinum]RFZ21398.1 Mercuric reductase [Mycobacterium marinum]